MNLFSAMPMISLLIKLCILALVTSMLLFAYVVQHDDFYSH